MSGLAAQKKALAAASKEEEDELPLKTTADDTPNLQEEDDNDEQQQQQQLLQQKLVETVVSSLEPVVQATQHYPLYNLLRTVLQGGDWDDLQPPQSTLQIPNYNSSMANTERHFYLVSIASVLVYAVLVGVSYYAVSAGNNASDDDDSSCPVQQLSPTEQSAAFLAFVCMLMTLILHMLPLLIVRRKENNAGSSSIRTISPPISGVVLAGVLVQAVAMTTNAIMAFGTRVPILIDPVTGARVHLLRWSEWAPLAFVMTFLVEGSDVPDPRWGLKLVYITSISQGLSAICGFVFPFCLGLKSWMIVMVFSVLTYLFIFLRLRYKEARFRLMRQGKRLDEIEIYIRSQIALRLLRTCAAGWTFLVGMYFSFSVGAPMLAPEGSLLRNPAVPMISEAFCDVFLKFFYLSYIVSMHTQVFDEGARTKRRLEELRQMMWDNSSDVLAISVQSLSGVILTMVSPTFFKLLQSNNADGMSIGDSRGMIFELSKADFASLLHDREDSGNSKLVVKPKLYDFDFGGLTLQSMREKVHGSQDVSELIGGDEMQALAALVARSWQCESRDTLLSHDLVFRTEKADLETIKCEAKVTRLEESALFVVLRDISERFRRFEAEKLAATEMTARRKDQEVNRFTRHEVKNGLLAALGLCDSLAEIANKGAQGTDVLAKITAGLDQEQRAEISKLALVHHDISRLVTEMDASLHEVLNTILAEAMARDVIHGAYEPQLERLDIAELLKSISKRAEGTFERFPVTTSPSPFPIFQFDRQLLICIHRNAISNACKYGAKGGIVKTHLMYDFDTKMLHMDVTNQPGENHEELVKLGRDGAELVFVPSTQLHAGFDSGGKYPNALASHSAGDGAWIMRKCARTLRGHCLIDFREDCTIFSFACPATLISELHGGADDLASAFNFPKGTWGIAIDDSKMQRKLLGRFLGLAGIAKDRILVLGATSEEITSFDDFVVGFIEDHPSDHFLLIVDENLDCPIADFSMLQHTTISGSSMVQDIRHRLLPEQERQMLALIRSANDSSHDVAIYNSRAHGFMPKVPLKKGSALELLAPLWEKHFASLDDTVSLSSSSGTLTRTMSETSFSESSASDDLMEYIRAIDLIVAKSVVDISEHWSTIWEKLHAFKGDLLSSLDSEEVNVIVGLIGDMRGQNLPVDFLSKWKKLRRLITELLAYPDESVLPPDDRQVSSVRPRKSTSGRDKHPLAYT